MIRVRGILNKRAAIRTRLDVASGAEGAIALAGQNDHAAIAVLLGSIYGGHDPVCDFTV
jgi:hypothetical protein